MGPLKRSQSMVGIVNKKKMPLSPQGMEMKAKMVSYVEAHGGHRPVHTILIANNGDREIQPRSRRDLVEM